MPSLLGVLGWAERLEQKPSMCKKKHLPVVSTRRRRPGRWPKSGAPGAYSSPTRLYQLYQKGGLTSSSKVRPGKMTRPGCDLVSESTAVPMAATGAWRQRTGDTLPHASFQFSFYKRNRVWISRPHESGACCLPAISGTIFKLFPKVDKQ